MGSKRAKNEQVHHEMKSRYFYSEKHQIYRRLFDCVAKVATQPATIV